MHSYHNGMGFKALKSCAVSHPCVDRVTCSIFPSPCQVAALPLPLQHQSLPNLLRTGDRHFIEANMAEIERLQQKSLLPQLPNELLIRIFDLAYPKHPVPLRQTGMMRLGRVCLRFHEVAQFLREGIFAVKTAKVANKLIRRLRKQCPDIIEHLYLGGEIYEIQTGSPVEEQTAWTELIGFLGSRVRSITIKRTNGLKGLVELLDDDTVSLS